MGQVPKSNNGGALLALVSAWPHGALICRFASPMDGCWQPAWATSECQWLTPTSSPIQNSCGKTPSVPTQQVLQMHPIKSDSWIKFPSGRNVLMTSQVLHGVCLRDARAQAGKCFILQRLKTFTFQAFELNAN